MIMTDNKKVSKIKINKKTLRIVEIITTCLIFLSMIFWYYYVSQNKTLDAVLFPPISSIIDNVIQDKDQFVLNLVSSLTILFPSILITLIISLVLGSFIGLHKKVREAVYPVIYAFSCAPSILLSTFVLVLSPSFWWGSVILIIYECLWATLFATITGVESIDKRYLESADTLKLNKFNQFFKIILPAASPTILGGFTNSLRSAFVILVFAEMYSGARNGLGFYVDKYSKIGIYSKVWAGFIFMVLVLIVVMAIFEKIKKQILKWTID